MKMNITSKITVLFLLLASFVIFNFILLFNVEKGMKEKQAWVLHTHEVIAESERFLGYLRDAETGQRGFLLTLNNAYLDPYHDGTEKAQSKIVLIKELTKDNIEQQKLLGQIHGLMQEKFSELKTTVQFAQQDKISEAMDIVNANTGKLIMDKIRGHVDELLSVEKTLLEGRESAYLNQTKFLNKLFYLELTALVLLIGIFCVYIQKSIAYPIRSIADFVKKTRDAFDGSELELKPRSDEIGTLANEFNNMIRNIKEQTYNRNLIAKLGNTKDELEKQQTVLESLLESIPDATVLTDQERRIVKINKAFTDIFGYTLDEIRGKPTAVFYESEEEFLRQGRLRFNVSPEKKNEPYIVSYRKKDGSIFPGETVGTKVFTPDGKVVGFFGLMRDVSEKLRQEEELRQAHKMEAIGTLSGGIAHEFNNLLAIIGSNVDLVHHKQHSRDNPEENIGNIKATVSRAKNLVAQILTFSRQEKKKRSVVDLSNVVANTLKLLRSTIPTTVEIISKVNHSESVFVNADTTQLSQVIINLCTNAVQAMNERGQLTIHLEKVDLQHNDLPPRIESQAGCYAALSVTDTGEGIEPEHLRHIFDPFYTTKEVGYGTGMGLAVSHGIIVQHNGFITVDSTLGAGTTFHVYLPVTQTQQHEPGVEVEDDLPSGTERILFVDDEECLAESCKELLEYQGYTVTSFMDSREALDHFKEKPESFDLVITDQTMPGMSGVELAEELLKIRPEMPIILCSGYTAQISEDDIKKIGIREFCMKPLDIKTLAVVTRKVLDKTDSLN